MAFTHCDQGILGAKDQHRVVYTVSVSDSLTQLPLEAVNIQLFSALGDSLVGETDADGRYEFPVIASSHNYFLIAKSGYKAVDREDTVTGEIDSIFNRSQRRILEVFLSPTQAGSPRLQSNASDTLNSSDSLEFHFEQPLGTLDFLEVRMVNITQGLWIDYSLDSSRKILSVYPKNEAWLPGMEYAYSLRAKNASGQNFRLNQDTASLVQGYFSVRLDDVVEKNQSIPQLFRFAYFNSGVSPRFDSTDVESSPFPDSTSRFSRLKWTWSNDLGVRPDSLFAYIKDGSSYPSWVRWTAFPGSLDSVTLDWADAYRMPGITSQRPQFPLRGNANAEIQVRIVHGHGGGLQSERDTLLKPIRQGMGASLNARFRLDHTLDVDGVSTDSIDVNFFAHWPDSAESYDFGIPLTELNEKLKPRLLRNGQADASLNWRWINSKSGRLYYSFPAPPAPHTFLQVDINGLVHLGRPLWHRNREDGVELP
jgi:hypothetical protein